MPPVQPSLRQKMKSAIRPSQNTGAEMPKSAKPIAARSTIDRRLTAESTPMPTPTTSQMIAAPKISQSVLGARSLIWSLTGTKPL